MNLPVISNAGDPVGPLRGEDPPEKGRATHSSILAGEFHGQKSWSLAGYTPWGRKELDPTAGANTYLYIKNICTLNIFSNSVAYLIFLTISFEKQQFFIFMRSHLPIFLLFISTLNNLCLIQSYKGFIIYFHLVSWH